MSTPGFSTISYSLRRTFQAGEMDLDGYFAFCRELDFIALDPWGPHLTGLRELSKPAFEAKGEIDYALNDADRAYLDDVKAKAEAVKLPFGCVAADSVTYLYEPEPWKRAVTRSLAKRWIEACGRLGVKQMRFDPGQFHQPEVPDDVFGVIVEGYEDLIDFARPHGIEILIENHWGCAGYPTVVERFLDAVEGLGCLFDTFNFALGTQGDGWRRLAPRAKAVHIKCKHWTDDGQELTTNLPQAIRLLRDHGYAGTWGIESIPADPDVTERDGIRRTMDLVRRSLETT
jgi:sugar phosphate isomerase/epimerase